MVLNRTVIFLLPRVQCIGDINLKCKMGSMRGEILIEVMLILEHLVMAIVWSKGKVEESFI